MASLLVIAAYAIPVLLGLALYLRFRKHPDALEAMAVSWAVGWACICVIEIVGNQLLGLRLDGSFFAAVSAALIVPTGLLLVLSRQRLWSLVGKVKLPPELRSGRGLAYLTLFVSFIGLMFYKAIITPPDSTDALVYHMELPKLAFATGNFPATPGLGWLEITTAWSGLIETQQLWIYLGGGQANELLVRPIMPVYSALLLLLVFRDVLRSNGLVAAGLAAAILFSLNEFVSLTTVLWAEVPVAFYSYLAVRQYLEVPIGLRSKFAAGAFAGMAGLVKYDGLILLFAVSVGYGVAALRERNGEVTQSLARRAINGGRNFAIPVAVGLLVASPLLLRNTLTFGNPIYPFIWGGKNTEQIAYFTADSSWSDYVRFRIHETVVLLGSIVTATIVLGLLRLRSWTRNETLLLTVLVFYLAIYLYPPLGGSHIRYLAPILPIAAVLSGRNLSWWLSGSSLEARKRGSALILSLMGLAILLLVIVDVKPPYLIQYVGTFLALGAVILLGAAALKLKRGERFAQRIALVMAATILLPGVFAVAADRYPPREVTWDLALLPEDPAIFLNQRLGDDWRMWHWINLNTPLGATILTFEARLFYLDRGVIFGADHILLPTYSMLLGDAVAYVRGLGVTYVLDSPWSHNPDINRIFWTRSVLFQNLGNQTYFTVVHAENGVRLYSL